MLIRIIEPYSRVQVDYVSTKIDLPKDQVSHGEDVPVTGYLILIIG